MVLIVFILLSHVRPLSRLPGPPGFVPQRPYGLHLHPLAGRHGLRLLLRLLRHPVEGGPQARGAVVPQKPQ